MLCIVLYEIVFFHNSVMENLVFSLAINETAHKHPLIRPGLSPDPAMPMGQSLRSLRDSRAFAKQGIRLLVIFRKRLRIAKLN